MPLLDAAAIRFGATVANPIPESSPVDEALPRPAATFIAMVTIGGGVEACVVEDEAGKNDRGGDSGGVADVDE